MATLDHVIQQMRDAGLPDLPAGHPVLDAKFHRFGPKKKAWYKLQEFTLQSGEVLITGSFGVWQGAEQNTVRVEMDWKGISAEERAAAEAKRRDEERAAADKAKRKADAAANRARFQWSTGAREGSSAYIERKKITAPGVRYGADGSILIPAVVFDNAWKAQLVGLQKITPDGAKRFDTGMAKQGACCPISQVGADDALLFLAEGYATARSISMATDGAVGGYVGFDAGNLAHVARMARARHPNTHILFCADDDYQLERRLHDWLLDAYKIGGTVEIDGAERQLTADDGAAVSVTVSWAKDVCGVPYILADVRSGRRVSTRKFENTGIASARAAAKEVGNASVVWPRFADRGDRKWTDFNDLHCEESLDQCREQLAAAILRALAPPEDIPPEPGSDADPDPVLAAHTDDPLYQAAVDVVMKNSRVSISLIQRNLRIGYNRAARLIEQMELAGLVSSPRSDGSREILERGSNVVELKSRKPKSSSATAVKPKAEDGRRRAGAGGEQSRRAFFSVNEEGVWYHGFDQRGEPLSPLWICSELRISAHSRDAGNGDWGYLLEFSDSDGNQKRWVMPATMLAGDGTAYRAILLGMGLRIGTSVMAKNHLSVYIQTEKTDARVRCTDRIGWHDDVYVLPDRTIGESDELVMFQAAGGVVSQFKQRGNLAEWRDNLAVHCRGNSRLLFCVSTAFAAPLMHLAHIPSGGFHIWGDSSSGKSTAFKVAGSVFGGKDYPRNWRMTDNALETVAAQHSDALLLLDEIAQVDPKVVGDTVYMLANEAGKGRATQTATARKVATWRLLFLSDGEVSLSNHMEQAGKGSKAGHDVRMAHIAADAGKGLGVFDTVHRFESGAALSDHLMKMSHQYYGTAGMALIEHAVRDLANISDALTSGIAELVRELCPLDSHGQVARVAARFALVGLAGEIATAAGITGWEAGEAIAAARTCFGTWLEGRGGAGNVEHVAILRQVSGFFQAHGNARFVSWHRATDDHAPNTINRAGFRRLLTGEGISINSNTDHHKAYGDRVHPDESEQIEQEYFVLTEVFKNEICKGFNPKLVTQLLVKKGLLMTEGSGDKASATRKERLPGMGLVRCYRFRPGIVTAEP